MQNYLIRVRDILRDSLGDHMVASTVFAKRIRTIMRSYENGMSARDCARYIGNDTEFADSDGYEK